MQGQPTELKWCLGFAEVAKPLVLNATKMHDMEYITNSDDSDDWINVQIVLYVDPTISFGSKVTGGIRIRAPRNQQQSAPAIPPVPAQPPSSGPADSHEDIPL